MKDLRNEQKFPSWVELDAQHVTEYYKNTKKEQPLCLEMSDNSAINEFRHQIKVEGCYKSEANGRDSDLNNRDAYLLNTTAGMLG